jgi:hypothetical protein
MGVLDDIRRAAFELRQTDPQEAIRILRRAAQQGGEAEVLARGALGEIREAGDRKGAETAFLRAIEGLSRDVRGFREGGTLPAGAEEIVLTLLETAVELAEVRKEAALLDEEVLSWAASQRLFDAEGDRDDWVRFHGLWTRLRILTGRPEEAVTALREAERTGELPPAEAKELLQLALKELGAPAVVPLGKKA